MMKLIHGLSRVVVIAVMGLLESGTASAMFEFTTPDFFLPGFRGDGLIGSVWTSVRNPGCPAANDPNDPITPPCQPQEKTLANAVNYMHANTPIAVFNASAVQFPKGRRPAPDDRSISIGAFLGFDSETLRSSIYEYPGELPLMRCQGDCFDPNADRFGTIMRFTGYYRVNTPGIVQFNIESDDGADILIQGIQVALNDGVHGYQGLLNDKGEPTVSAVNFTTPGLYALEIDWFDGEPVQAGIAFGTGLFPLTSRTIVPNDLLYTSPIPEPGTGALTVLCLAALWNTLREKSVKQRRHL